MDWSILQRLIFNLGKLLNLPPVKKLLKHGAIDRVCIHLSYDRVPCPQVWVRLPLDLRIHGGQPTLHIITRTWQASSFMTHSKGLTNSFRYVDHCDHFHCLTYHKVLWPTDASLLHHAHNACLDALEAGILAKLEQNMTKLANVEVKMIESWVDMVQLHKLCQKCQ